MKVPQQNYHRSDWKICLTVKVKELQTSATARKLRQGGIEKSGFSALS